MIEYQCSCGRSGKVSDRFAGKLARCPNCGQQVRIPGGWPEPTPAPAAMTEDIALSPPADLPPHEASDVPQAGMVDGTKGSFGSAYGLTKRVQSTPSVAHIIVGSLILLTLILPWFSVPDRPLLKDAGKLIMSWDIIGAAPAIVTVALLGCWCIGLTTILLAATLRGRPLHICYVALGITGVFILFLPWVEISAASAGVGPDVPSGAIAFSLISTVGFLFLLVVSEIRLRTAASTPGRVVHGVAAGLLLILTVVSLFLGIANFGDLPQEARRVLAFDFAVIAIIGNLAVAAACILAIIHVATLRDTKPSLTTASLWTLYSILAFTAIYVIVRPATLTGVSAFALLALNMVLLFGGIVVILCSGIVLLVVDMLGMQAASPSTHASADTIGIPVPPVGPAARLHELAELMQRGLISPEEYVEMKRSILEKMK